jgi:hypothetical protein
MKHTLKHVAFRKLYLPLLAAILFISAAQPYTAIQNAEVQRGGPTWEFNLLNQMGGSMRAIAVQGETVYVGAGPRLVTVDISDPENPQFLGQTEMLPHLVENIVINGNFAYVAASYAGLQIIDISNPQLPLIVGSETDPTLAFAIAYTNNHVFITDPETGTLRLLNVSDPTHPSPVWSLNGFGGGTDVLVNGDYLYTVMDTLEVFDISNITQPKLVTSLPANTLDNGWFYSLAVAENSLYAISVTSEFYVFDISQPDLPEKKGMIFLDHNQYLSFDIVVVNQHAYLADYYGLTLIDISDPQNMVKIGDLTPFWFTSQLAVVNNIAFLINWDGMHVIRINDPISPEVIGAYEPGSFMNRMAIIGDYAYLYGVSDSAVVYDISEPSTPQMTARYADICWHEIVAYSDQIAFATCDSGNMSIVDTANPALPQTIKEIPVRSVGMAIQDQSLFVINGINSQFLVFDLTDAYNPQQTGSLTLSGSPSGLVLVGNYAYTRIGLQIIIIDISTPCNPTQVSSFTIDDEHAPMVTEGAILVIGQNESGLAVFDLSNPLTPTKLAEIDTPGAVYDLAIKDSLVYAADYSGVAVVSVTDPSQPQMVAYHPVINTALVWPSGAGEVVLKDDLVFVNANAAGVYIFENEYQWTMYLPLVAR